MPDILIHIRWLNSIIKVRKYLYIIHAFVRPHEKRDESQSVLRTTYLDEPEYPSDPEDPDDPEEGGRDGEVGHHVLHDDAHDGGDHQNKVEHVPPRREVHEAQADDLDDALFGRRKMVALQLDKTDNMSAI